MALVLWFFFLLTSLYHVLVTVVVYGWGWHQPEFLVIVRDGLWFVLFAVALIVYRKKIRVYLQHTWYLWLLFFILAAVSYAISFVHQRTASDMIVGAKYGLQFFVIFLSSIFFGMVFVQYPQKDYSHLLKRLFYLLVALLIGWLMWQGAKMVWPDVFYAIGYAPFGDWVFGHNPPLYYLTWPGGYPRLSGIFSWPNNYWYLLVAVFGFWWRYIRTSVVEMKTRIALWVLFALSVVGTLSRGAIMGIFLQLIALAFVVFRAKRKYIWWLVAVGVGAVVLLSLMKRGSTLAHLRTKLGSLSYVWANPRGYGLGSSWPSIHTWHGTILPENFFVQVLIDIGIPWLILWLFFWYVVLRNTRTIKKKSTMEQRTSTLLLTCLSFSFLWLMLEWMFLHVFEDSMVNYWFFILWGIVYGYLQAQPSLHHHKS